MGVNFIEDFGNIGNEGKRVKFPGVLGSMAPEAIPPHRLGDPGYRFPSRGRGWFNESYRHSLAARGIPTRSDLRGKTLEEQHGLLRRMWGERPFFDSNSGWWEEGNYGIGGLGNFEPGEFDLDFELELAEDTRDTWIKLWKQRDPDLNILKHTIDKSNVDYYIDEYPHMNIIFHKDRDYYGRGVGGHGGGKVFWFPYTYQDAEGVMYEFPSFGTDNIRVLAHELSHAFGSHTEFTDDWNDMVAYVVHIEHGTINRDMLDSLDTKSVTVIFHRDDKRKSRYVRNAIATMRYLYRTYGEDVMDAILSMGRERYPEDLQYMKEGLHLG
jgi:hypothetical protein